MQKKGRKENCCCMHIFPTFFQDANQWFFKDKWGYIEIPNLLNEASNFAFVAKN